jgi:hypothetical protein
MTVVAIHQPNFFPWLGYFDKIVRADVFVFLDTVQMPLTGSGYANRVTILAGGKEQNLQMPVARGSQTREKLLTTPIAELPNWREKLIRSIQQSYARAPFAREITPLLEPLISNEAGFVGPYNEHAVRTISRMLGVPDSKFRRASDLEISGRSNDLLISIVKSVAGDIYMAGGGAAGYQNDTLFEEAGLCVTYQRFVHPIYSQMKNTSFVPGLSIIDALMNLGLEGTRCLLMNR